MTEFSRRSLLEKILTVSIGGAGISLMGGIGYLAATEPSFPNYIFHGEIDGEHIALYPPKQAPIDRFRPRSNNLVLEVNKQDGNKDVHPTWDLNNDIVFDFLVNGGIFTGSKRKTTLYVGNKSGELYSAFVIENGAVKEKLKGTKEAAMQFTNYLRKIREHKQ